MEAMATAVRAGRRGRWPAPGTITDAWTADDLRSLPDDGLRYEIVDGTLLVSPAPSKRHQRVSRRLHRLLEDVCPEGLEVFSAPLDWAIDDSTVVEPDIMVVPRGPVDAPVGSPVLVVEVASPSSRQLDRVIKFERYRIAGVRQYWIVDPGSADRGPGVEVYDLVAGAYRLQCRAAGSDTTAVSGPVPASVTAEDLVSDR